MSASRQADGPHLFTAVLERDADGTWWYVHMPADVRQGLRHAERHRYTPMHVTIGGTTWAASLMPWADGSAQIVVNTRREPRGTPARRRRARPGRHRLPRAR